MQKTHGERLWRSLCVDMHFISVLDCAQIFEWVKEHGGEPIVPFSGALESKLFDMPDDEKAAYLKEVFAQFSLGCYTCCCLPCQSPRHHMATHGETRQRGACGGLAAVLYLLYFDVCKVDWQHFGAMLDGALPDVAERGGFGAAQDHHDGLPGNPAHLLLHSRRRRGQVLADPQGRQGTPGTYEEIVSQK